MTRPFVLLLLAVLMGLPLAACGRKSTPATPVGAYYPRHYPEIDGNNQSLPQNQPQAEPAAAPVPATPPPFADLQHPPAEGAPKQ